MRQSNWNASIVRTATIRRLFWWRMISANPAALGEADVETRPRDHHPGPAHRFSKATRSASSPSIPLNAGRRTSPRTSRTSLRRPLRSSQMRDIPLFLRTLPTGYEGRYRGTSSCRCQGTWPDDGVPAQRSQWRSASKAPFPRLHRAALLTSIENVPSGQRWLRDQFRRYRVQVRSPTRRAAADRTEGKVRHPFFKGLRETCDALNGRVTAGLSFIGKRTKKLTNRATCVTDAMKGVPRIICARVGNRQLAQFSLKEPSSVGASVTWVARTVCYRMTSDVGRCRRCRSACIRCEVRFTLEPQFSFSREQVFGRPAHVP